MSIRKYIPNTITCLSLVAGCISIVMALGGNMLWAAVWIIIGAVLDFMDGFMARLLKAFSPIGKELDSLADVVSFGVAPGMMVFALLREACAGMPFGVASPYVPYLAFVIPAFSGLRLAKFNIDVRQATSFIGLPVPAHALFWSSLSYSLLPLVHHNGLLLAVAVAIAAFLTSLLLVSEIPMFSLKIKSVSWKGNEVRYILVVCGLAFILLFQFLGVAGTIFLYVLLSVFTKNKSAHV